MPDRITEKLMLTSIRQDFSVLREESLAFKCQHLLSFPEFGFVHNSHLIFFSEKSVFKFHLPQL